MSRWVERARRRRQDGEGGFTLIEIMVALTLVAIAAGGAIPLLIVGMKAANNAKLNTQAKNLAQQRMESMRDLPFHVDRQNGPFVDLLDIYYTNTSSTHVTHSRANETEDGHWVSGGAASPAPSGPFYQLSVAQLPGFPQFSQTVDTQFLSVTGKPVSVAANTYDNLTTGKDQPLSTIVGVTVITTWSDHGVSHTYTSYTRISDSRGLSSALSTQGSASFLRVSSAGPTGNALTVDVASADATGDLSTGSVAAADIRTIEARDASGSVYEGATATAESPGSTQASGFLGALDSSAGGTCGWVEAGPTQYSDVTADTSSNGLPKVPLDVDTNSPPTHQATAQLMSGSNTCAGIFGFNNQSTAYSSNLMLGSDVHQPLVSILNAGSNSVTVSGSAWVNASASTADPHTATSGANTSSTKGVVLFPSATFTNGAGVLKIKLTQSSIACSSSVTGGSATQSSTGSWTATISYWKSTDTSGGGSMTDLGTYTWNSATDSGSADPLAAIDPSTLVVYQNGSTVLHLSDYISSWNTTRKITEDANSGVHQLGGIVSIATQPVRDGDLLSAVGLQVGNLSCVADDNR